MSVMQLAFFSPQSKSVIMKIYQAETDNTVCLSYENEDVWAISR